MKAQISNRIYFSGLTPEQVAAIMQLTTYKTKVATGSSGKFPLVEVTKLHRQSIFGNKLIVSVPAGRTDLIPPDCELVEKRVLVPAEFPNPLMQLRPAQQPVVDSITDSVILNAKVGWGKTVAALHIIAKLGQRALVVTHTGMLRDQWVEQCKAVLGIEPDVIKEGKLPEITSSVVIGNVQTVTKFAKELAKQFGTLVVDECHRVACDTFVDIVDNSYARYKVGLSGTINRTDGKGFYLQNFFSSTIISPPQADTLSPVVKLVRTNLVLPPAKDFATKVNNLMYSEDYQAFIALQVLEQIDKGHKVLVVSDRSEFLRGVKHYVGDSAQIVDGSVTDMNERARILERLETDVDCILGTRGIWTEGISANPLSCVILCILTSNPIVLEQLIGRIQRLYPGKQTPLVVDIAFASGPERAQLRKRLEFYAAKGWKIVQ